MNNGKVMLGVLAGVAAGALIGILFAPDKGSKTRRKILDKSEDYADDLKTKITDLWESITEKFETAKEDAEKAISNGKAKVEDGLHMAKGRITEG